ncbi:MAG: XRE family transcriptional regulator [Desulfovibrio sp.]|nr:MAG: XRE family transcriptional regulator [Desulfovibrio sp.]
MLRLREFRQGAEWTQQRLAQELSTTQQTIARWERGQSEPPLRVLRELAEIFNTSIDGLLGHAGIDGPRGSLLDMYLKKPLPKEVWGYFGLRLPEWEVSQWHPVTTWAARRIERTMASAEAGQGWLCFRTLANRLLAFRIPAAVQFSLRSIASEPPHGDWQEEQVRKPRGQALYRNLAEFLNDREWMSRTDTSQRGAVYAFMQEKKLNEKGLAAYLHDTHILCKGGRKLSYRVKTAQLCSLVRAVGRGRAGAPVLELSEFLGAFRNFFPESGLALVDMPLMDVMAHAARFQDEAVGR